MNTAVESKKQSDLRDPQVEAWIKSFNVGFYDVQMIPLSLISVKESRNNQARRDAIEDDSVERYAQAVKNGDRLPPIVVFKKGDGFVIIDGNNRDAGHRKAGAKEIAVYIIHGTTASEVIELMKAAANRQHGKNTPTEWALRQAVSLINLGWSVEEVAKRLVLSDQAIYKFQKLLAADQRAAKLRAAGWDGLADSVKRDLHRIKLDTVFIETVRLAVTTGFTGTDLGRFVGEVNRLGSEAEQLAAVAQKQADRIVAKKQKDAMGKVARRNPKQHLASAIGSVLKIESDQALQVLITDFEREEYAKQADDAAEHLMELAAALRADKK